MDVLKMISSMVGVGCALTVIVPLGGGHDPGFRLSDDNGYAGSDQIYQLE
jgi:hypothetical protein